MAHDCIKTYIHHRVQQWLVSKNLTFLDLKIDTTYVTFPGKLLGVCCRKQIVFWTYWNMPYLYLPYGLWGVFCEYLGDNLPCCNRTAHIPVKVTLDISRSPIGSHWGSRKNILGNLTALCSALTISMMCVVYNHDHIMTVKHVLSAVDEIIRYISFRYHHWLGKKCWQVWKIRTSVFLKLPISNLCVLGTIWTNFGCLPHTFLQRLLMFISTIVYLQ